MSAKIESKIKELAKNFNYEINEKNLSRIAKAKCMFFGEDDWSRCPCYPKDDTEHGCGSAACAKEIMQHRVCHCNLFMKRKTDERF